MVSNSVLLYVNHVLLKLTTHSLFQCKRIVLFLQQLLNSSTNCNVMMNLQFDNKQCNLHMINLCRGRINYSYCHPAHLNIKYASFLYYTPIFSCCQSHRKHQFILGSSIHKDMSRESYLLI